MDCKLCTRKDATRNKHEHKVYLVFHSGRGIKEWVDELNFLSSIRITALSNPTSKERKDVRPHTPMSPYSAVLSIKVALSRSMAERLSKSDI